MVFRDSLQFLAQSLQTLVDSLAKCERPNQPTKFSMLKRVISERHMAAPWKRLGVFPYEHVKTFTTLDEQQLPLRAAVHSSLSGATCSEDDYAYAQSVWREFGCRTLREYMQFYLTTEVCLLADVFENFRATCHEAYELDPAHFVSAPQLAWNAMFKRTKLEVKLLSDPEMHRMIQPNIRGGICHASVRYAKANNKYMGALYDPTKEDSYILYIDANNLYGWAMSQALPKYSYAWLSEAEVREAETALTSDNRAKRLGFFDMGARARRELARAVNAELNNVLPNPPIEEIDFSMQYILEVDLEYPGEIHDREDDYPYAPERMEIKTEMLSAKHLQLRRKYYGAATPYSRKLVSSLLPKKKYVLHSENLKFFLERGMKVTNVHRGIKFSTSDYLKVVAFMVLFQ